MANLLHVQAKTHYGWSMSRWFTYSFARSFVNLLGQSVSKSFTFSYTPAACTGENSLELIHLSLIHLLVCSFVRSFIHSLIPSVSQSVSQYIIHVFICLFLLSFVHSSIHLFRQSVSSLGQYRIFLDPRPQKFNCVAALPQLKSYLL